MASLDLNAYKLYKYRHFQKTVFIQIMTELLYPNVFVIKYLSILYVDLAV